MSKLPLNANQTKSTKQIKPKIKKPVRVVYISNPMKVKTSASKFRALVQELTGQDSDLTRHVASRVFEQDDDVPSHENVPDEEAMVLDHVPKVQASKTMMCSGSDIATYEDYGGSSSSLFFDMAQVMGMGLYSSSDLWC